jgi:hypothetical protein
MRYSILTFVVASGFRFRVSLDDKEEEEKEEVEEDAKKVEVDDGLLDGNWFSFPPRGGLCNSKRGRFVDDDGVVGVLAFDGYNEDRWANGVRNVDVVSDDSGCRIPPSGNGANDDIADFGNDFLIAICSARGQLSVVTPLAFGGT